jgi:hypothetical protein
VPPDHPSPPHCENWATQGVGVGFAVGIGVMDLQEDAPYEEVVPSGHTSDICDPASQ